MTFLKKVVKITKVTKRSIISLISSADLTKLKSLLKLHDQTVVPLRCFGPNPPQPEAQFSNYDIIRQCQQISNCNGCRVSFDKIDENLYILQAIGLEWYRKGTTLIKHYKRGQRNTYYCAKKDASSVTGHI